MPSVSPISVHGPLELRNVARPITTPTGKHYDYVKSAKATNGPMCLASGSLLASKGHMDLWVVVRHVKLTIA